VNSEMHLEVEIKCNSKIDLAAVIAEVWRCIWRPRSTGSEMYLEAEIKLNCEIHLEGMMERVWTSISRKGLCN